MKVQTARKNTSPIRIYHAHAMCTYGTRIARAERKQIRTRFPRAKIIDPDKYEGNIEKKIKGMKYCFELIKKCDALVFSRLLKKVTAGVGLEVRYALANHIRVYELRDEQIKS
ncbi:MAG TPA: hypothetical protein VJZ03_07725, partial [Candidatus Bathyarchaeia archaeon]|nr:hypothetical protein [Candidatus Bathyarchaeia archaeon]